MYKRQRESLVGEQSRIVNRMKAALIRLGIRGFNPKLKKAAGRLEDLRTPEDEPIPPNTLAELRRDMERRRLVRDQIRQIEEARLECLEHAPCDGPHAMVPVSYTHLDVYKRQGFTVLSPKQSCQ